MMGRLGIALCLGVLLTSTSVPASAQKKPESTPPQDKAGAPPPPPAAAPLPSTAEPAKPVPSPDVKVTLIELPARKKARQLVDKAKTLAETDTWRAYTLLKRAAAFDPTYARAWRAIGDLRVKMGLHSQASQAYRRYLELAPTATDKTEVEETLGWLTANPK